VVMLFGLLGVGSLWGAFVQGVVGGVLLVCCCGSIVVVCCNSAVISLKNKII